MPSAGLILLGIALILLVLALRGYVREGRLLAQHRSWLTIALIFIVVTVVVTFVS